MDQEKAIQLHNKILTMLEGENVEPGLTANVFLNLTAVALVLAGYTRAQVAAEPYLLRAFDNAVRAGEHYDNVTH